MFNPNDKFTVIIRGFFGKVEDQTWITMCRNCLDKRDDIKLFTVRPSDPSCKCQYCGN